MLWGDQWICKCGWHNFILRKKCRNCGGEKEKTSVREEGYEAIIERIEKEQAQDLKLIPDDKFIII